MSTGKKRITKRKYQRKSAPAVGPWKTQKYYWQDGIAIKIEWIYIDS